LYVRTVTTSRLPVKLYLARSKKQPLEEQRYEYEVHKPTHTRARARRERELRVRQARAPTNT